MKVIAVVLLWLAAGYRFHALRNRRNLTNGSYCAAVVAIAAGYTVAAGETAVDAVTGPYVSDLVEHLLVVVGGVCAQMFLLALRAGPLPRRAAVLRTTIAATVSVVMVVSFALAPIHQGVIGDLDAVYGQLGEIAVYRLAFDGYLTYVLVDNIRLCRRYVAIRGDLARSISLTLVGWGSAAGLAYSGSRVIYVLLDLTLNIHAAVVRTVGSAAAGIGLSGLAVGMIAAPLVGGIRRWLRCCLGTRHLSPLWGDLTAAFPALVLPTPLPLSPRRAELRYDRRLVEVSEGLWHARLDSGPTASLVGIEEVGEAAVELRRTRLTWATAVGPAADSLLPVPDNLQAERAMLVALADAYGRPASKTRALTRTAP